MTQVLLITTLVLGAVIQAVWPAWESFGQSKIPVLLAIVLYYTLTRPAGIAILAAVLAGLLQDALTRTPLGYSSFIYVLISVFVLYFKELIFIHKTITHIVFGALANVFSTLGIFILLQVGGYIDPTPGWVFSKLLGALILGVLAVPLIIAALDFVDQSLGFDLEERLA